MGLFSKFSGARSRREVRRAMPAVGRIEALRPEMVALSDAELRARTDGFRRRLAAGETLDGILPEAYAVVREAARRVLGMEHYRVQLVGGIILHQGRIAEMRTGEGKTLVSTLPAYLNALPGRGVHIVTVNDYLAKRDAGWMGQVHEFLGLSVGAVLGGMDGDARRRAYNADITYVTNSEVGFDYLRDNMATDRGQAVQRGLDYAIIDEVDSVLIDEARTPLIISGRGGRSTELYGMCDELARQLRRGEADEFTKMDAILGEDVRETGDFIADEKGRRVSLTADGVRKVEQFFHIDNLADPENLEVQHNIILALRAHNLMERDRDYVVRDGQVLIVDEFTGRILPGRRYSDGLHQAVEAKEHVTVNSENRTLASITYQNLFNKYEKKCGMTGTAKTEELEFRDIYSMDVVEIPTNRPVIRVDRDDVVYRTKQEKYRAVVDAVASAHASGRPVLVGTATVGVSEVLDGMLREKGIPHNVLNAKNHEAEAGIVAGAGAYGAVTVATNMAGRGTDIRLDDRARAAGGLLVIGTERHESRRVDNQLRGRAGRQGDPGESQFYVSLEDDLLRLFGSEKLMGMFTALGVGDGEPVRHRMLSKAVTGAQRRVEGNNYGIRKSVLEYDMVMDRQRETVYGARQQVLDGMDMRGAVSNMLRQFVSDTVDAHFSGGALDLGAFNAEFLDVIPVRPLAEGDVKGHTAQEIKQGLVGRAERAYGAKEREFPDAGAMRAAERVAILKATDAKWMNHIDDMDQLRQGIGLQAYGQKDPLTEYKVEGHAMFSEMAGGIYRDALRLLFRMQPVRKEPMTVMGTNRDGRAVLVRGTDMPGTDDN